MDEKTDQRDRFNWRLPAFAAVGAAIAVASLIIIVDPIFVMMYLFIAAPIIAFFILIAAIVKKGRRLELLSALVVFCVVTWGVLRARVPLRPIARWFFLSGVYKSQFFDQPDPLHGMLKHMEWDAWGFPGAGNTTVYLVFDPLDSLSTPAKTHSSGKPSGLPCEVAEIRKMESQYYAVMFYTDTD